MAAALVAIEGLTAATETANVLAKSAGSVMDIIGKALSNIVNMFIQPLAPIMTYLMAQIVFGLIGFKAWWDNLPKWFDENVFKPIAEWIDTYIVKPFWAFFDGIGKWIDDYIVKPFWKWVNDVPIWVDTYIVKPFWKFFSDIYSWIDTYIVKPFWKWFSDIPKWIDDNLTKPFWNFIHGIPSWVDSNITKPFWSFFNGVSSWVNTYITTPFRNVFYSISGWVYTYITSPFWNFVYGAQGAFNSLVSGITRAVLNVPYIGNLLYGLGLRAYETGGVVPGSGAQLAIVHGGETITPAGKSSGQNITLNFYGYQDDKFVQKVKDVLRSQGTVYNL